MMVDTRVVACGICITFKWRLKDNTPIASVAGTVWPPSATRSAEDKKRGRANWQKGNRLSMVHHLGSLTIASQNATRTCQAHNKLRPGSTLLDFVGYFR